MEDHSFCRNQYAVFTGGILLASMIYDLASKMIYKPYYLAVEIKVD